MNNKFCLIGNTNIGYSLSPYIYNYLANYYDVSDFSYEIVGVDSLEDVNFANYQGYNITIPYKQEILNYINKYDPVVGFTNCANMVNHNIGYNTDLPAFIHVFNKLVKEEVESITILGKGSMGQMIQKYFLNLKKKVNVIYYQDQEIDPCAYGAEVLINTTPCGQGGYEDQLPIDRKYISNFKYIIDLNYTPDVNPFLICAKYYEIPHINGIEMLIHQAISNFSIWYDLTPNYDLIPLIKQAIDAYRFKGLALIGMPFSGKTLIGKQYPGSYDLDEYIEATIKEPIYDYIKREGESAFRDLETAILERVITKFNPPIISLGGGIVERWQNLFILRHYKLVFVNRGINYLERYFDDSRPLYCDLKQLQATYERRMPIYHQWQTKL